MRLTLVQLEQDTGSVDAALDAAEATVEDAAADGADLVALPELFAVGYFAFESYARVAEGLDGRTFGRLRDIAADYDVGLLAGSHVEDLEASADAGYDVPDDTGLANTTTFFDRDGSLRTTYRKHHLFGYESAEERLLTAGQRLEPFEFDGFTVGTCTCYDLRFPELTRELVDEGVTLLLVPSAWPYPRVEHWQTLTRARAIENLWYLGAINGVGTFESATLLGRSTVYDPWGTPLSSAGDTAARVTADLAPDEVTRVREEFPALSDRR